MKKLLASLLLGAGLMFGGFSAMAQDAAKPAEAPAAAEIGRASCRERV